LAVNLQSEWERRDDSSLTDPQCTCNLSPSLTPNAHFAVHVGHMGERRGVYRVLVGKHEGKRPPGSLAPQLGISQKALGTLPEDGNVMPKHV
jgi:hypothetical protein